MTRDQFRDLLVVVYLNNKSSSNSKHIEIRFPVGTYKVKDSLIVVEHCGAMIVDPLNKGFAPRFFNEHESKWVFLTLLAFWVNRQVCDHM